mmetsp:Transcript_2419/g.6494  ORF Transcript_2419/g.6494 Transcript_2419/m.6494 type:complete len:265 (+) Transcript_2419:588-1382(+)
MAGVSPDPTWPRRPRSSSVAGWVLSPPRIPGAGPEGGGSGLVRGHGRDHSRQPQRSDAEHGRHQALPGLRDILLQWLCRHQHAAIPRVLGIRGRPREGPGRGPGRHDGRSRSLSGILRKPPHRVGPQHGKRVPGISASNPGGSERNSRRRGGGNAPLPGRRQPARRRELLFGRLWSVLRPDPPVSGQREAPGTGRAFVGPRGLLHPADVEVGPVLREEHRLFRIGRFQTQGHRHRCYEEAEEEKSWILLVLWCQTRSIAQLNQK